VWFAGDRGRGTKAGINDDLSAARLDRVTVPRGPAIRALTARGAAPPPLPGEQEVAEITHPGDPSRRGGPPGANGWEILALQTQP
jgi:hypothetical protein